MRDGHPSEAELLFEIVSVYPKATAAQIMNDFRLPRCPTTRVAPLDFPRVASDQVSYQQTVANALHINFVILRVNDRAILTVAAEGQAGAPTTRMEAFARKAYSRAKSKLVG